jgi:protein-tyrosine phosphatase
MIPTRVLPLAGSCNFRDCGGYTTLQGARVRWGRLYRSGVLQGLSTAATASVEALGLRAVCDLRRNAERARYPNPAFGTHVRRFEWDTGQEASPIHGQDFAGEAAATRARERMLRMYERMPFELRPRFAGVFEALAHTGDGATIVHCMAGKDRTGVAIALVLSALDVPRDVILADYALTNEAVDLRAQITQRKAAGAGLAASAEPLLSLSQAALDAVLAAHPEYLLASFEAIEARHGSVHAYLRAELAVPESTLARLRETMLE